MLIIKNIYLIVSYIVLFFLVGSFIESLRKKSYLSYRLAYSCVVSILAIVLFCATLYITSISVVRILFSIYLCCLNMAIFAMIQLEAAFSNKKVSTKKLKRINKLLYLLLILDGVFILSNNFVGGIYSIAPIYYDDVFLSWKLIGSFPFHIHFLLCTVIVGILITRFSKDIENIDKVYRKRFLIVVALYTNVYIVNIFYLAFSKYLKLDYSLLIYSLVVIISFYYLIYATPRALQRHMLTSASDSISDAVVCFDNSRKCIFSNEKAKLILSEDISNEEWLQKYFDSKENYILKSETLLLDGEPHVYDVEYRRILDEDSKISGYYIKMYDKTDDLREIEREEFRATHDELTGLYNRGYFFVEAERILTTSPDIPRYLVCTDIKNFKLINDLFGSKFGDNLLKHQANMLTQAKYEDCIHGRISGDRFAMLIRKENFNYELAAENTSKIKEFVKDINFQLTVNIGVYEISNPYENVHTMYDKANLAIKNNKDPYNQVVSFYDTSLMRKILIEKNVIDDFNKALKSNQFCMFLQPQIESKTGKCLGAEALVRWYDPEKGYRQPSDFIPVLEQHGLIYDLDYYIWEKAAYQLHEWAENGFENYYISVNISAVDFYYADLYSVFTELVERYEINPSRLNLEITESVLIENTKMNKNIIAALRDYGFKVEMDDFGSGYSSLRALQENEMDVLKIDMEFLHETENEERGQLVIESIVKMAKALNMSVVTEGVENEKQVKFLQNIDVDLFQGFYYSKPLAVYDFEHKFMGESL